MEDQGLKNAPINAVLITHEHQDHVGGAAVLARQLAKKRKPVPFWMTRGTWEGCKPACRPDGAEFIEAGDAFFCADIGLDAIPVPHDTVDPIAWRVRLGGACAAVITDLGRPTKLIARSMQDCDALVLEFNHDEQMLLDGPYPLHLKQRIRGNHGHLSNSQAAEILADGAGPKLQHVLLAHLSEENNRPEIARELATSVLARGGWPATVHLTRQRAAVPAVRMDVNPFG